MYFNATVEVTAGRKGETICRPGGWVDVAKFFIFNYVVHALTVVNTPGAKKLRSVNASLTAILLPFSGAYRAFQAMAFYRWGEEDSLDKALRAQALCTLVPSEHHPTGDVLFPALNVIEVHGQHSVPPYGFLEWTGLKKPTLKPHYQLSRVPWWFAVTPLKQPSNNPQKKLDRSKSTSQQPNVDQNPISETQLSCNQNVLKIFAAILQILSGLFQIYQARGNQFERYGYSAYSLTVIPYVLMSLVNLLACACIPQYPMMYIVFYGGKKRPIPKCTIKKQDKGSTASMPGKHSSKDKKKIDGQVSGQKERKLLVERSGDEQEPLLQDEGCPPGEDSHQSTNSTPTETEDGIKEDIEDEDCPPAEGSHQSTNSTPTEMDDGIKEDIEDGADDKWKDNVREMVSGAVGVAYGDWDFSKRDKTLPQSEVSMTIRLLLYLVAVIVIGAPYVIMQLLTNFQVGQSTRSQRSWILAWLIMGQLGGLLAGVWENDYWRVITRLPRLPSATVTRFLISFSIVLSMSIGTIGGFVVAGNMILEDEVCTVI